MENKKWYLMTGFNRDTADRWKEELGDDMYYFRLNDTPIVLIKLTKMRAFLLRSYLIKENILKGTGVYLKNFARN